MTCRMTITVDDHLKEELDRIIAERGYRSRSEAIRDLARTGLRQANQDAGGAGWCGAVLVYAYKYSSRKLPNRLAQIFHEYPSLSVASMRLHHDADMCIEVNVLKGEFLAIKELTNRIIAERGIHHGRVTIIPIESARRVVRRQFRERNSPVSMPRLPD